MTRNRTFETNIPLKIQEEAWEKYMEFDRDEMIFMDRLCKLGQAAMHDKTRAIVHGLDENSVWFNIPLSDKAEPVVTARLYTNGSRSAELDCLVASVPNAVAANIGGDVLLGSYIANRLGAEIRVLPVNAWRSEIRIRYKCTVSIGLENAFNDFAGAFAAFNAMVWEALENLCGHVEYAPYLVSMKYTGGCWLEAWELIQKITGLSRAEAEQVFTDIDLQKKPFIPAGSSEEAERIVSALRTVEIDSAIVKRRGVAKTEDTEAVGG